MAQPDSARRRLLAGLGPVLLLLLPVRFAQAAPDWPELKQTIRHKFPEVPQWSVPQLAARLADTHQPAPLLVDVRPEAEYADGHLAGAVRADSERAVRRLLERRPPGQVAVLYCSVGWRSSKLAEALIEDGAQGVVNLEGSIFEWANTGHPVVAEHGPAGRVHPYDRDWGRLLDRKLWSRVP